MEETPQAHPPAGLCRSAVGKA